MLKRIQYTPTSGEVKRHGVGDTAISPRMSNVFDRQTWEIAAIYPKIWGLFPKYGKEILTKSCLSMG
jgi:hypothetical protein